MKLLKIAKKSFKKQYKNLVISAKHHKIPKIGKVEDKKEHLIRVLSKENTKLAPEEFVQLFIIAHKASFTCVYLS